MLPLPAYYAILTVFVAYVFLRGGAPERWAAAILGVGSVLSTLFISARPLRFSSVESGVFAIDVLVLVAFLILALRAERYWTLWVAALQLIGTAGHAVKLVDSHVIRLVYAFMMAFWTYPMLLCVLVGTWRHRQRLARFGADRSWSTSSVRSAAVRKRGPTG